MAGLLAQRLNLTLLEPELTPNTLEEGSLLVTVSENLPALQLTGRRAPGAVSLSFDDPTLRHRRRGGHNELLGRAVGWRRDRAPVVLDATAGYARDAFVLADLGCRVILCERQPVMAVLLEMALESARKDSDSWLQSVAERMLLHGYDAREIPFSSHCDVNVIYLDPMFIAERKSAPGKAMQVLQALTGKAAGAVDDAPALLTWARSQPVRRVVVKRSRRAPTLSGDAPAHRVMGRAVRFDIYHGAADASRWQGEDAQ